MLVKMATGLVDIQANVSFTYSGPARKVNVSFALGAIGIWPISAFTPEAGMQAVAPWNLLAAPKFSPSLYTVPVKLRIPVGVSLKVYDAKTAILSTTGVELASQTDASVVEVKEEIPFESTFSDLRATYF